MGIKEEIRLIAERMLELRTEAEVEYHPYRKESFISFNDILSYMQIDLMKLYPNAKDGDIAYVKTILQSSADYDITIMVRGNVKVIFNNAVVYDYEKEPSEQYNILTHANCGDNELIFVCRCTDGNFGADFVPSVRHYPGMWAKDYLLNIRVVCPIKDFADEEGVAVSKLYTSEENSDVEYIYPKNAGNNNEIMFDKIFPDIKGNVGYAYTECINDTELKINELSECRIFVNGIENAGNIHLKKGDKVLVAAYRGEKWGFSYSSEGIGISFLKSNRKEGDKWLTVAGFDRSARVEIQFEKPYNIDNGKKIFWKIENENDYLRPYINSCFYGQWFYAVMVGHYGLKKAGEILNETKYTDYFINSMNDMARFYMYIQYDYEKFGMPSFMQRAVKPYDLDSIGTMGMNMCELYKTTHKGDALVSALRLYEAMRSNIQTFDDGTFNRRITMWADDTFMSCPFLVRLANILGDREISDFAANQLMGFKKYLYMSDKNIFSHIYFVNEKTPNRIPWGRGNGWVFVTLSDALELLPEETVNRSELLELFQSFAEGIKRLQGKNGLWHQVLDRSDSYEETSCTAMFIIGMCKGIRNGWLDKTYVETIKKAHDGIMKYAVDKKGNVSGVCKGSGCSMDAEYYMQLGAVDNDDHGTGIILWALNEMERLNMKTS